MENSEEKISATETEIPTEPETTDTVPETIEEPTPDGKKEVVYGDKVMTKEQKIKFEILRWSLLHVGILLMSVSVYFFQVPNNFTLGGVGGISIIISKMQNVLTQAQIMAIINVFLLIVGFIILGKQCTLRTAYCSLLYTGLIWVFETVDILGLITQTPTLKGGTPIPMTDQPFLELCFSILLFGVGGAIIFNFGASSGGTDIIALIMKKYTKLNVGMALMIVDLIVVAISAYTFQSATTILFSLLGLFARTFLLDGVIESIGKTKYITIITRKPEIIAEYILNVIKHGYTMYDAEGGYTGEKKKVLITVCKRGEALKLKTQVKAVEPDAFVIITDANEILGKGFGNAN